MYWLPRHSAVHQGIGINGSVEFVASTRAALELLAPTDHWSLVREHINVMVQKRSGCAYVHSADGCFRVGHYVWKRDLREYAAAVAFEAYRNHYYAGSALLWDPTLEDACIERVCEVMRDIRMSADSMRGELARLTISAMQRASADARAPLLFRLRLAVRRHLLQRRASCESVVILGSAPFIELTLAALNTLRGSSRFGTICSAIDCIVESAVHRARQEGAKRIVLIDSADGLTDSVHYAGIIAHEAYHHILGWGIREDPFEDALSYEKACLEFEASVREELGDISGAEFCRFLQAYPAYIETPVASDPMRVVALMLVIFGVSGLSSAMCAGWLSSP